MNAWEIIGYGVEIGVILRHIKEHFGQGPSKAKLQEEFFLTEQQKTETLKSLLVGLNSTLSDYMHCILAGMIIVS